MNIANLFFLFAVSPDAAGAAARDDSQLGRDRGLRRVKVHACLPAFLSRCEWVPGAPCRTSDSLCITTCPDRSKCSPSRSATSVAQRVRIGARLTRIGEGAGERMAWR